MPVSADMKPKTEKIASPEMTEAPELKPDKIQHHLNVLKSYLKLNLISKI